MTWYVIGICTGIFIWKAIKFGFVRWQTRKHQRIRCDFLIYSDPLRKCSLRCIEAKEFELKDIISEGTFPQTLCKAHYEFLARNFNRTALVLAYRKIELAN